ncbi:MAG: hypothetical protein ACKOYC_02650 [Bacteroidota bacterium]
MTKTAIFALILMACSLIGLLIYRILPNEYGLAVSIVFAVAGIVTGLSQTKDASGREPEWRRNLKEWLSFKKRKKS